MQENLFTWACKKIEAAEESLGHELSWRFLATSSRTLSPSSRIAFIALNPGGDRIPADHGKESSESGSAHLHEVWKSRLPQQVDGLFKQIASSLKASDYKSLMDDSLMAYYIPFRSRNYASLKRKEESRAFAFQLWSQIMQKILPELIISIDRRTFSSMHKILTTSNKVEQTGGREMPTGWGNYTASINCYVAPRRHIVLVRFPHLSRFKIFNRPESEPYTREIVAEMTKFM